MKNVHVVMTTDYRANALVAFIDRKDALSTACSIHGCSVDEANDYIKTVPLIMDQPTKIDLCDFDKIVNVVLKAYDSVSTNLKEHCNEAKD